MSRTAQLRGSRRHWPRVTQRNVDPVFFEQHPHVERQEVQERKIHKKGRSQGTKRMRREGKGNKEDAGGWVIVGITANHLAAGVIPNREKRKNHKSVEKLLAVPHYRDLLDDQHDEEESERRHAIFSSQIFWRTELAKWKSAALENRGSQSRGFWRD
ncbi:hypothetical protein B0H10DRAFT_1960386 [Mycena sp. CBHHK59/15]|nr:hypothetical protein B0H10DRAFT_1962739 [Mycena sp. CBHHK59/15]KAJ6595459.1 hypothetical protein B0H10DRAFT_1960386 [Mycena sp. CBHHK59/15]